MTWKKPKKTEASNNSSLPGGAQYSMKNPKSPQIESKSRPVFSSPAERGHNLEGLGVRLICWESPQGPVYKFPEELHAAVQVGIKCLKENSVDPHKSVIIYSASLLRESPTEFDFLPILEKYEGIQAFYNFETSSQEFMAVVFVLYVPEDFQLSIEVKLTILSQIYQAITRAQIFLVIVADSDSIARLKTVVTRFDEFLTEKHKVDLIFDIFLDLHLYLKFQ